MSILIIISIISGAGIYASTITKPYTFSSGDTIVASEINDNFDTVYAKVNENTSAINNISLTNKLLIPDDLDGEVVELAFTNSEYTVPAGKTLYVFSVSTLYTGIMSMFKDTPSGLRTLFSVEGHRTFNFMSPLIIKSGTVLTPGSSVDLVMRGMLVEEGAEIVNTNCYQSTNAYTVPTGKKFYVTHISGHPIIVVNGVVKYHCTGTFTTFSNFPLIFNEGDVIYGSSYTTLSGYLK